MKAREFAALAAKVAEHDPEAEVVAVTTGLASIFSRSHAVTGVVTGSAGVTPLVMVRYEERAWAR